MKTIEFNKVLLTYLYDIIDMFKKGTDNNFCYWIECTEKTYDCIVYDLEKMCSQSDYLDISINDTNIFIYLIEYHEIKATYQIKIKIVK